MPINSPYSCHPFAENWEDHGERNIVPGSENMATVHSLRPATTYHLRIIARNNLGDSDPSDTVTIITAEEGEEGLQLPS